MKSDYYARLIRTDDVGIIRLLQYLYSIDVIDNKNDPTPISQEMIAHTRANLYPLMHDYEKRLSEVYEDTGVSLMLLALVWSTRGEWSQAADAEWCASNGDGLKKMLGVFPEDRRIILTKAWIDGRESTDDRRDDNED